MSKRRKTRAEGDVEVRFLVDTTHDGVTYPCNTVHALDADTAAAMVGAGFADDTPEGVEVGRESAENKAHEAKLEAAARKNARDDD